MVRSNLFASIGAEITPQVLDELSRELKWWELRLPFPDDYLVLDVATSGTNVESDLVVGLGMCFVQSREVCDRVHVGLDWSEEPGIDHESLRASLIKSTSAAAQVPDSHVTGLYPLNYLSYEKVLPAREALEHFLPLLSDPEARGDTIIGHHGWSFDLPILGGHALELLRTELRITGERFIDTGMLVKAVQRSQRPGPSEPLGEFWTRMNQMRWPGVRWSLDHHCVPLFRLKHRCKMRGLEPYRADHDAYLAHLLLEALRDLAAG